VSLAPPPNTRITTPPASADVPKERPRPQLRGAPFGRKPSDPRPGILPPRITATTVVAHVVYAASTTCNRDRDMVPRGCGSQQGVRVMDSSRFDCLTKSLAAPSGRRTVAKLLAGGALGAVGLTALNAKPAAASRCRQRGEYCGRDGRCCSDCCKGGICKRSLRCD